MQQQFFTLLGVVQYPSPPSVQIQIYIDIYVDIQIYRFFKGTKNGENKKEKNLFEVISAPNSPFLIILGLSFKISLWSMTH